jgi:hypothetical protein
MHRITVLSVAAKFNHTTSGLKKELTTLENNTMQNIWIYEKWCNERNGLKWVL